MSYHLFLNCTHQNTLVDQTDLHRNSVMKLGVARLGTAIDIQAQLTKCVALLGLQYVYQMCTTISPVFSSELRENIRHSTQTQSFIAITIPGGCTRKHAGRQAQTTHNISAKRSYLQWNPVF